ncbi:MAG TPA: acyltransferase [Candidatus Elarobacter sp.]|nr:acyltransferase [Candidatus Elarobacter sp.]
MSSPQPQRTYFPHVEGFRGVAALYVFLYHAWQSAVAHAGATLTVLLPFTLPWLQFGHFAVSVFIVISGYCLGMPVATRPERPFNRRAFARRRARRLGPAYLLALALTLIPFYATLALRGQHVPFSHVAGALIAHVFLVHNLWEPVAGYLNGPMWSIALEVQIYVVFALLLVPVWRRVGPWAQLGVALVLGLAPQLLLHGALAYTAPWMLTLFAMGVVAAHVTARGVVPGWLRYVALATAAAGVLMVLPQGDAAADGALWPADLVVGAAVALLFVTSSGTAQPLTARFLALRPIVVLGTFSYSLYLIHAPLVILVAAAADRWHFGTAASAVAYGLLIPFTVALAYAFYRVAERPFLSPEFRAAIEAEPTVEQPLRDSSPPTPIVAAYEGA